MAVGSMSLNNSSADAITIYCPLNSVYEVFSLEYGNAHNLLVYLKDYTKSFRYKKFLMNILIQKIYLMKLKTGRI